MGKRPEFRRGGKKNSKFKPKQNRFPLSDGIRDGEFTCVHCGLPVSCDRVVAGVVNRNHCPYCLWSRHLDAREAGDRLAACKGPMQPVGLTLKKVHKKYANADRGELMLIHQCVECGKLSINRIAADDDTETLLKMFVGSFELDTQLKKQLEEAGIEILQASDSQEVETQLRGNTYNSDNDGEWS